MTRLLKALNSSTKTSLRIDDEGLLSLQFLMPSPRAKGALGPAQNSGTEAFIEFRVSMETLLRTKADSDGSSVYRLMRIFETNLTPSPHQRRCRVLPSHESDTPILVSKFHGRTSTFDLALISGRLWVDCRKHAMVACRDGSTALLSSHV